MEIGTLEWRVTFGFFAVEGRESVGQRPTNSPAHLFQRSFLGATRDHEVGILPITIAISHRTLARLADILKFRLESCIEDEAALTRQGHRLLGFGGTHLVSVISP